jgi:cysteine-rich repeat protein
MSWRTHGGRGVGRADHPGARRVKDVARMGLGGLLGPLLVVAACGSGSGSVTDAAGEETTDGAAGETADAGPDWGDPDFGELPPASCGNGTVEPGEECDDGNRMNGDGCDWACRLGDGEFDAGAPDPDAGRLTVDAETTSIDPGVDVGPFMLPWFLDEIPLEWTGDAYATVWPHDPASSGGAASEATFIRFDTSGHRLGGGWTYHFGELWQAFDLAWAGSSFGLCLADTSAGTVLFVALDRNGKPETDPFVVATMSDSSPWSGVPFRIVADGGGFSCGWPGFDIVRLDLDGVQREGGSRSLAALFPWSATLAWSGSSYLVTWAGEGASPDEATARFLVLDENLTPFPGAGVLGPLGLNGAMNVRGAWLGDRFGIAWPVPGPGAIEDPDRLCTIHVAFVDRRGELLGPPVPEPDTYPHLGAYIPAAGLAVAGGSASLAVAIFGGVPATATQDLRLLRFDRHGAFIEKVEVAELGPGSLSELRGPLGIAFDGAGFGIIAQGMVGARPLFFRWALLP